MTSNDYSGTAVGLAIALVVVLGGIAMVAGFGASATTDRIGATAAVNADATAPAAVDQENNTTTVEQEDDTVTVGQEGGTTTVDRADDATANATSNYSTVGQLNESTLQEMSREELVDRILSLQQVLNQTEELYLSQIRTLHAELNETEQRVRELERRLNETNGTVTVDAETAREPDVTAETTREPNVTSPDGDTATVEGETVTEGVSQETVTTTAEASANATSNYSTVGQLNESALQEMSREELVDRTQSLQQVLNQTEELYLSQIRTLHGELNETEQRVRELERRLNETTQNAADDSSR